MCLLRLLDRIGVTAGHHRSRVAPRSIEGNDVFDERLLRRALRFVAGATIPFTVRNVTDALVTDAMFSRLWLEIQIQTRGSHSP